MGIGARNLLDAATGACLLYVAVCVYELGNYVALSLLGSQVSLSTWWIIPLGVSATVQASPLLPVAKALQVAITLAFSLGVFHLARSRPFPLTRTMALATASIYLASSYWEMLSLVGQLSYEVHLVVFTALAIATQQGLARFLRA